MDRNKTVEEKLVYTTPCGMFRVIQQNEEFFPEWRKFSLQGDPILTMQRVEEIRQESRFAHEIQETGWNRWGLGYFQDRSRSLKSKGCKRYKSARAAIRYIDAEALCRIDQGSTW